MGALARSKCVAAVLAASVLLATTAAGQARTIVRADGNPNSYMGASDVVLGDVDGDGRSDWLAGASSDGAVGSATIRSGLDGGELRRHDGESSGGLMGYAVELLGDVDGDGVADYVVSSPFYFDPIQQQTAGKIYVYSGASGALIWSKVGFGDYRQWGYVLTYVGDADGDGIGDFIVNKNAGGTVQGGRVELTSGADGSVLWFVDGLNRLDSLGKFVVRVSDVDGDGLVDVAITVPFESSGTGLHGRVTLLSGRTGAELWTVWGDNADEFARFLANAGDYDGDGFDDVAVGAPTAGSSNEGEIRFLSGVDGSQLGVIVGDHPFEELGWEFSPGFDADGDGDLDLAAVDRDTSTTHTLFLYDEHSSQQLAQIWTGVDVLDFDGIAKAGDLDQDGFADLIVGLPHENSDAGASIVFGFRSPPALTSVTPDRGDHHGGAAVTIAGSGFALANSLQVSFGGVAASNVLVVDDATITCTAPSGPAGLDDVVVTTDAGSSTLAAGFAATPALRIDGDPVIGGTITLRFLCDAGDDLFVVYGLPPIVSIPTPPYEGELCILPFLPVLYLPGWTSDELDLGGSIPNDPALIGLHVLVQGLVGAPLTGPGKNGSWTNCGDIAIH